MRGTAKIRFAAFLKRSYFIRFHMATILVATVLCGLLLSKILLSLGVGLIRRLRTQRAPCRCHFEDEVATTRACRLTLDRIRFQGVRSAHP